MNHVVDIPEIQPGNGLRFVWDEGFEIEVTVNSRELSIKANRPGLTSLARHLLTLAQEGVREGAHIHLTADQEIDSDVDLIIERIAESSNRVCPACRRE